MVKQNLALIKADMTVSLAGTFALIALQDKIDTNDNVDDDNKIFARLMSNLGKSVISKRSVDNVHHCLDGIGGNGAIENTSSMPRLLRDCIILENWEGTHNTLYMQTLRDIQRYQHDKVYLRVMATLIAKIPASLDTAKLNAEKLNAEQAYAALQLDLDNFHQADDALKTLKIAPIVTQMADLYYYVSAVLEGIDQASKSDTRSKLLCAELFHLNIMRHEEATLDAHYLNVCDQIITLGE